MSGTFEEVFVPSLLSMSDETTALGCFSSEDVAWEVLKSHLQHELSEKYHSASIVKWVVDVVGQEAFEVRTTMNCRECPACRRSTFWIDFESSKGQCQQVACQAWIEEKSEDEVHCGWPPVHYSNQVSSLSEAMKTLHERASEADAAGSSGGGVELTDDSENHWSNKA
ncbi:MAG: hypothetical protein VW230_01595 [Candidatus Poseidoniales archaeon]